MKDKTSILRGLAAFAICVVAMSFAALAQTTDQAAKLISLPKLQPRPKSERHMFGTKMTVTVAVDAKGKVTEVKAIDGPGWICPSVELPEVTALREAAKAVAMKAKFVPAVVDGRRVSSEALLEIEFPPRAMQASVEGVRVRGHSDNSNSGNERTLKGEEQSNNGTISGSSSGTPTIATERQVLPKTLNDGPLNRNALEMPQPKYPAAARAVKASGSVRVEVLIGEDGKMLSAEPVSGHPLLRTASRVAACGARFMPTTLSGKPVKVRGYITYNYVP